MFFWSVYHGISWQSVRVTTRPNIRSFSKSTKKTAEASIHGVIHGVRGFINNIPVLVPTASETKYNVISEQFAHQCRLDIRRYTETFVVGSGREINAVGKTNASWQFDGEAVGMKTVEFVVLSTCIQPIIFGNNFLRHTRTLGTNWHRLKWENTELDFSCVHILGTPPQSIAGTIRRNPVHALPATGCDINIVSEKYVHSLELSHKIKEERQETIKLMDGSMVKSVGEIGLTWAFGDERFLDSYPWLRFSVLPNCPYDVVLGRDLLFNSNTFLRYSDCLRQETPSSHKLEAGITIMPSILLAFSRKPGIPEAIKATGDSSILQELNRRAAADREILKQTGSDRTELWKTELDRRANWNAGIVKEPGDGGGDGDGGSHGSFVRSSNPESKATDMASDSLATSVKEHSLLADDHSSSGSYLGSDSSYDSGGSSDGGGDGGD